jgi:hypothetical protein
MYSLMLRWCVLSFVIFSLVNSLPVMMAIIWRTRAVGETKNDYCRFIQAHLARATPFLIAAKLPESHPSPYISRVEEFEQLQTRFPLLPDMLSDIVFRYLQRDASYGSLLNRLFYIAQSIYLSVEDWICFRETIFS